MKRAGAGCGSRAARALRFKVQGFVSCQLGGKYCDSSIAAYCQADEQDLGAYLIERGRAANVKIREQHFMSEYFATVAWRRNGQNFLDGKYSRGHIWKFDGGAEIRASSSPHVVPVPMSVEEFVDPEEAFVASLSSCHMLFFLHLASKAKLIIEEYVDDAIGIMEKNEEGKLALTEVTLRPRIVLSESTQASRDQLESLHHEAHELCFIANSVTTKVTTEII